MFIDHAALIEKLKDYASPRAKITRMLKAGELVKIRRGIFLPGNAENYSRKSLAGIIYGPSYISFETALSYHGMIPERVNVITSATFNKNKNKHFKTPIGDFFYYYLPSTVYPYSVECANENGMNFLLASPEKALCDQIYRLGKAACARELKELLVENWRIEPETLQKLDRKTIKFIAPLYRRKVFTALIELIDGGLL